MRKRKQSKPEQARPVGPSTSYKRPGLRPDAETVMLPSLGQGRSSRRDAAPGGAAPGGAAPGGAAPGGAAPGGAAPGGAAAQALAPARTGPAQPADLMSLAPGSWPSSGNGHGDVLTALNGTRSGPAPSAGEPYQPTPRRTWVSRGVLLVVMALQAFLALRLHNTAFEDEALYLYSGHMELEHLLHGAALQGDYAQFFSGAPVLYPVLGSLVNGLGGLVAARLASTAAMLTTTGLLYAMTRRLFNERVALSAALLFAVTEPAIFLANFATYDASTLCLLALAAWIAVRTAQSRWPLYLLATPVAALAVGTKYAALLFVPTIALLPTLAGWPQRGRRLLIAPVLFGLTVAGLLYAALHFAGAQYATAISTTTTARAQGVTPLTTLLRESALWGGVLFSCAVLGTVAYAWRPTIETAEQIAPTGGVVRRAALGVVLTGTALLAPAVQILLHTDISFQKHIGFGLFFAAPMAGVGFVRIIGGHFRRPQFGVAIWGAALLLGMVQSGTLYDGWPNSDTFVSALSRYLKPGARYLVEEPEIPVYYLLGRQDAQPRQFTSTFFIRYTDRQGQTLFGVPGYVAAVKDGYFNVIVYQNAATPAVDQALASTLESSKSYQLARVVPNHDSFGAGAYYIWVKRAPRHRTKHAGTRHTRAGHLKAGQPGVRTKA